MKRFLRVLFCLALSTFGFPVLSCAQDPILFSRCYGGLSQEDFGWSVIDAPPGVIMTGRTGSTNGDVVGLHGDQDGWVVRTNVFGNITWSRCYGGSSQETFYRTIKTADDNLLHVGFSTAINGDVTYNYGMSDFWVVKTDTLGTIIWQKSYGGSADDCAYAALDFNDGTYLIGGISHSTNGLITGHHGTASRRDVWIIKISALDGHFIWEKSYGGTDDEGTTQSHDYSRLFNMISYDSSSFAFTTTARSQDGDVTGNDGTNSFWLVKTDTSGQIIFQETYGGSGHDFSYNLVKTLDAGFLLVGGSSSNDGDVNGHHGSSTTYDYWVVRTDSSGVIMWQRSCGGSGNDDAYGACVTPLGFYVVGRSESVNGDLLGQGSQGSMDAWVFYLDYNGVFMWRRCFGGGAWDHGNDVLVTSDGMVTCSGVAASNDGDVFNNHGGYDFWLVKLNDVTDVKEEISSADAVAVFPNPGTDRISFTNLETDVRVDVYDVIGNLVESTFTSGFSLDCSHLPAGMYEFVLYGESTVPARLRWIRIASN